MDIPGDSQKVGDRMSGPHATVRRTIADYSVFFTDF